MNQYSEGQRRDYRVILAWIVLALQIIGLLWLLLFARDRLAAWTGGADRGGETAALTEPTTAPAATAVAESTAAPTDAPPAAPEGDAAGAAVLKPEDVTVDASAVAPDWFVTLIEGSAAGASAGQPAMPPHLLLSFADPDDPAAGSAEFGPIDLNQPQLRIIPVATLLDMLRARDDEAGRQALEDLLSLLEQRPDIETAAIPVPPVLGEVDQNFTSRAAFKSFGGGEGVGYVTHISGEDVAPVTNESGLTYVYQGLTADGEQYVFMSWPLDGDFLPETAADAADEAETLAADRATYFSGLRDRVEAAADADLSPSLSSLSDLLRSLSIGGQVAAAAEEPAAAAQGPIGDVVGSTLQWPGYTNAAGETVTVADPENYTLTLLPNGRFNVRADCNVGGGVYTAGDDGSLQLESMRLSLALCPEGSSSDEFVSFLENVNGATVDADGGVTMTTADGRSATFANLGPPSETDDDPLLNTVWQWDSHTHPTGSGDLFLQDPEAYTLTFHPDGTYNVTADCNVGRGQFTREGRTLTLEPGAMTLAACPPESSGDAFVDYLQRVQFYRVTPDGRLELALDSDGLMTFSSGGRVIGGIEDSVDSVAQSQPAAEAGGLTGIALQWPGFTDANGDSVAVENPEDYSLVLFPDGTFTAKADCNVANGLFTYEDGGAITLLPLRQTMALCAENSRSDAFLDFLGRVNNLTVNEDGDVTMATDDGRSASFVNLGEVEMAGAESAAAEDEAAQPAAPTGDPLNTVWQWTGRTTADGAHELVDDPESYYLVLIDDGTYAFRADCNNGAGGYELDGSALRLLPAAVTLAACPEGSRSDEFVNAFGQVTGFEFDDDGNLWLTLDDGGRLSFADGGPFTGLDTGAETETAETANPLSGTTWQWTRFRDAKQDYTVSGNYAITFNADGTATVTADCNTANGTYSLSGEDGLTIRILATTAAACPAGSLSDTFIEYLNQAGTFAAAEGSLTIDLMAEGGTMTFTAAP